MPLQPATGRPALTVSPAAVADGVAQPTPLRHFGLHGSFHFASTYATATKIKTNRLVQYICTRLSRSGTSLTTLAAAEIGVVPVQSKRLGFFARRRWIAGSSLVITLVSVVGGDMAILQDPLTILWNHRLIRLFSLTGALRRVLSTAAGGPVHWTLPRNFRR